MEQIAVSFTDWWVPKTWLNPVVTIIDRTGKKYVENWLLTELGYGWYIYNFERYSPEKTYLYMFDWGSALSSDYDRYKFWGNEFDAYSNKYSWGRTAAPYFTSINSRFNNVDKAINDAVKSRKEYNDKNVIKWLADIKKEIKWKWWYDVYKRLDGLGKVLEEVKKSVVDTSSTNDWNNSKNFTGINEKLDLMAEYVVKIKWEIDNELNTVGDVIQQSIQESNTNLNEWLSSRVTIEQLLQQVNRLEEKLNEVVDSVVSKRLPRELTDKYDLNVMRKPNMSEEDVARALWLDMWLSQWVGEWLEEWLSSGIEEWMNEWLDEGIGQAREMWSNAPVDMQWIAEPVMPNSI
jgi:hypothetical protein